MNRDMRRYLAVFASVLTLGLIVAPQFAFDQGQGDVPNHAVPIGRGPGVIGFGSVAPGTSGYVLMSRGPGLDPFYAPAGTLTIPGIPALCPLFSTGTATPPAFRCIVGSDLPFPTSISLGAAFASASTSTTVLTGLNTDGTWSYARTNGTPQIAFFCGDSGIYNNCYSQDGRVALQLGANSDQGQYYRATTHSFLSTANENYLTLASGFLQVGGPDKGSPISALTMQVVGAAINNSNLAGQDFTLRLPLSTGNANPGNFVIKTGYAGTTSGTSVNGEGSTITVGPNRHLGSGTQPALQVSQFISGTGIVHTFDVQARTQATSTASRVIRARGGPTGVSSIFAVSNDASNPFIELGGRTILQYSSGSSAVLYAGGVGGFRFVNSSGSADNFTVSDTQGTVLFWNGAAFHTVNTGATPGGTSTWPTTSGTIINTGALNAVSNAMLSDMADSTIKCRTSGAGTGAPQDCSKTQLQAITKGVFIVAASGSALTVTGTTVDTTLATIAIPGNTLGANGQLEITALFSKTGATSGFIPNIKFGGTTFVGNSPTLLVTGGTAQFFSRISNRNATNAQIGGNLFNWSSVSTPAVTAALDTTASQNVTITCQLGNAADICTLESYSVKVVVP